MILKSDQIAARLNSHSDEQVNDPLAVIPCLGVDKLEQKGVASVDLRLGTWFASMRQHRIAILDVSDQQRIEYRRKQLETAAKIANIPDSFLKTIETIFPPTPTPSERVLTKMNYIPFGGDFILHPRSFALAVTLEWIRIPKNLAAYVIGKSSWGRRGLIIATAAGVHPGFTGCLTLELTNVGEIPIAIQPGMTICQLFVHQVHSESHDTNKSSFSCTRRPILGSVIPDDYAKKLALNNQNQ